MPQPRLAIDQETINQVLDRVREHLQVTMRKKGPGAFASRHEVLGVLVEEFRELEQAVRDGTLGDVREELLDIAGPAVFAIASINQSAFDW